VQLESWQREKWLTFIQPSALTVKPLPPSLSLSLCVSLSNYSVRLERALSFKHSYCEFTLDSSLHHERQSDGKSCNVLA